MNISISTNALLITATFQRRIWMQYILVIAIFPDRYKENTLDAIDLIRQIQRKLIDTVDEDMDQLLNVEMNKLQFGILHKVSFGFAISPDNKYSKIWDDSCKYVIHAHKLFS